MKIQITVSRLSLNPALEIYAYVKSQEHRNVLSIKKWVCLTPIKRFSPSFHRKKFLITNKSTSPSIKAQKCCDLINRIGRIFNWHRISEALRRFYCLASVKYFLAFRISVHTSEKQVEMSHILNVSVYSGPENISRCLSLGTASQDSSWYHLSPDTAIRIWLLL